MTEAIVKSIVVPCSAAHAFEVFVNRMGRWWPLDSHAASAKYGQPAQDVTVEPHVGGKIYEIMYDGGRDLWGEVLIYEPGQRFACTWHPGNNADFPTRLDISFEDEAGQARVTLTHSGWEIWADKADEMRGGYDGGWAVVFAERYAAACA